MIACIAPPDQKKMKMASYSPHPPVYLQQLSNIPGPSRRTLPLHSNLHNFRHVGVNGTQSTSQTLFPNAKKKRIVRSDSGGEYMSTGFSQYLISRGTVHQRSFAYTPWIAKRKNRYLLETIRAMMFGMNVPHLGRSCVDRNILEKYHSCLLWKHPWLVSFKRIWLLLFIFYFFEFL